MSKRDGSVFLAMLPIGAIAGFAIAALVTCLMPRIYESEAVIEVKPYFRGGTPCFSKPTLADQLAKYFGIDYFQRKEQQQRENSFSDGFCKDQFELIKRRPAIETVVERLNLTHRWKMDKETASKETHGIIDLRIVHGTSLISIRVRHANKVDARDIAMEVARAYQNCREEIDKREQAKDLVELNKAVKHQEEKVEESRKFLAKLVRNGGPHPELFRHDYSSDTPEEAIMRSNDKRNYDDAKRDFETDQQLLEVMKMKQMGETIVQKMPSDRVQIHQSPVIADSPVSPNVTLNLVSGTIIGFLIVPLISLPLTRIHRRRSMM